MNLEPNQCEQDLQSNHVDESAGASFPSVRFTLLDGYGNSWLIPAEVVETKHKKHQFLAHKSLDLQSDNWVVSHQATSAAVCGENTKERAIELAVNMLNGMTKKRLEENITKIRAKRKEIEDRAMPEINKS